MNLTKIKNISPPTTVEERPPRVLVVEDDAAHARLIERVFQQDAPAIEMSFARSIAAAEQALRTDEFDLVITDFSLPDGKGAELLPPNLTKATYPVMLFTGQGDERIAVDTIKAGAFDYVVKSEEEMRNLPKTVKRIMREWRSVLRQREMGQQLTQNQRELEANHKHLQTLFSKVAQGKEEWELTMDRLEDLIVLVDDHGRIRRANRALCELCDKGYEEVIDAPVADVFAECQIGFRDGSDPDLLVHDQRRGRWYNMQIYEISGSVIGPGIVLTGHHFTEIRQLNQRLEESNRGLEKKSLELEEAYNQLKSTQAKVLHQEKMATIGHLAAGVAHEINNPIGFILSNLRTLDRYLEKIKRYLQSQDRILAGNIDPEIDQQLRACRRSEKLDHILQDLGDLVVETIEGAGRVQNIVGDLKGFSHFDQEEESMADLNELLDSSVNIVWNEIKYKAELQRTFGEIARIRCHPRQLNQVFMNLLVNAAHAIKTHGRIDLQTWQEGNSVCAAVTDNGEGIPEDLQKRIFDPFFTTKDVGQGTGLGLSISYDIVKEHGGEIMVESRPGQGTTFTVRLPRQSAEEGNDANH